MACILKDRVETWWYLARARELVKDLTNPGQELTSGWLIIGEKIGEGLRIVLSGRRPEGGQRENPGELLDRRTVIRKPSRLIRAGLAARPRRNLVAAVTGKPCFKPLPALLGGLARTQAQGVSHLLPSHAAFPAYPHQAELLAVKSIPKLTDDAQGVEYIGSHDWARYSGRVRDHIPHRSEGIQGQSLEVVVTCGFASRGDPRSDLFGASYRALVLLVKAHMSIFH